MAAESRCLSCARNATLADLPPREQVYVGPRWRVAHAFGTSLPGWLVMVPRRHVITLDQLTAEEAADLGPLLRALTAALRAVLGCSKTYVALFAEAEGFEHVHFHVVPRSPDMDPGLRGPRVFGQLGGIPPVMCLPRSWTKWPSVSGKPCSWALDRPRHARFCPLAQAVCRRLGASVEVAGNWRRLRLPRHGS